MFTIDSKRVLLFGRLKYCPVVGKPGPLVPSFKSLYHSYKSGSLNMGYLDDPQGGPEECLFCYPQNTQAEKWPI